VCLQNDSTVRRPSGGDADDDDDDRDDMNCLLHLRATTCSQSTSVSTAIININNKKNFQSLLCGPPERAALCVATRPSVRPSRASDFLETGKS